VLDPEAVAKGKQTDLDELGVAKNAREEKLRAKKQQAGTSAPEDEQMAQLYRQHVLKEQPTLQIGGLGGKKKPVQEVLHKDQQ
jgi:7,8-dihydro-6-hydroxymethylpterin dimethyltransferase